MVPDVTLVPCKVFSVPPFSLPDPSKEEQSAERIAVCCQPLCQEKPYSLLDASMTLQVPLSNISPSKVYAASIIPSG